MSIARWLHQSQYYKIWYDIDNWQLGFNLYFGVEGVGIHIGFGPFDITIQKDY